MISAEIKPQSYPNIDVQYITTKRGYHYFNIH